MIDAAYNADLLRQATQGQDPHPIREPDVRPEAEEAEEAEDNSDNS